MKTVLTFIIAMICAFQVFAQKPEPLDTAQFSSPEEALLGTLLYRMAEKNENDLHRSITGKVVDENNSPLDFVNVVLLKADSTYIAGTVTDENGVFKFNEGQDNSKFVKVSSIGCTNQTIIIPPTGDIGIITLNPESVMLGEVVVKSNRPVTAIKGDALVTNVAGSQLEHAGTANDVLTQVPMVLGRDGNFEVFGKGSPAIYINGREVQDLSQLSQLNSADLSTNYIKIQIK